MANLLEEAIAEANLIKDLAVENAKATLVETFAPQIKNMLAAKLQEDEDVSGLFEEEEEEMEEVADEELEESDDEKMDDEEVEEAEDIDLDEIIRELEESLDESEDEEEMEESLGEGEDEEEVEEGKITKEQLESYLNEILEEMDDEGEEEEKVKEESVYESKQVAKLKKELNEAYSTIKKLHSVLQESVLINSKLKYTGKIFRAYDLDEKQKVAILESFDRAKSLRETKLCYTTISTTLREAKSSKQTSTVKRLKESRASKIVGSTKPSSEKVLLEDKTISRLKQLAGII